MRELRPSPDAPRARRKAYEVIFEHDTTAGRWFDVVLILAILASVGVVVMESVGSFRADHGPLLRRIEWGFTILFTVEYGLRLWCVTRPLRYARSFFGVVDLLAILPTYLAAILPGGQVLVTVRILRILRVFRILKLAQYVGEARLLGTALRASRVKITVFLFTVITLVVMLGSIVFLVEGRNPESGFTSIPTAMYWTVVTLTTVGYGDIAPITPLGQTLAAMIMVVGYGIIAVPTGIVSVELAQASRTLAEEDRQAALEAGRGRGACAGCGLRGHDPDASYCKRCGEGLPGGGGSRDAAPSPDPAP